MNNIFSWMFTVLFAGLIFTMFLYVASVIVPVLLLVLLVAFLVIRYRQKRILKIMLDTQKDVQKKTKTADIIDVEYEIIDNNRN